MSKVLIKNGKESVDEILKTKSIDLYKIISKTQAHMYSGTGELTLANVAFATLGLCKSEVYHELDIEKRGLPIDEGLIDHCVRDVEMTKELFFFMLKHHRVYHITSRAILDKKMVVPIDLPRLWTLPENERPNDLHFDKKHPIPPTRSIRDQFDEITG
jgi:hypothetical protein